MPARHSPSHSGTTSSTDLDDLQTRQGLNSKLKSDYVQHGTWLGPSIALGTMLPTGRLTANHMPCVGSLDKVPPRNSDDHPARQLLPERDQLEDGQEDFEVFGRPLPLPYTC